MSRFQVSPGQDVLNTTYLDSGIPTVIELLAPDGIEVNPGYLKTGGKFVRTLAVVGYPRSVPANFLSFLYSMDADLNISLHIHPADTRQAINSLTRHLGQMESTRLLDASRGKIPDPELAAALEDASQLRDRLQRGEEKLFFLSLYIAIWADTIEQLEKVTRQLETALAARMLIPKRTTFRQESGFRSVLPLGIDSLQALRNLDTSALSAAFPFTSNELTSGDGILYGLNAHNNTLAIFNRFEMENANECVFAKSGAGKSYLVKLECIRYLYSGVRIAIIDPENEYERLCSALGGQYVRIAAGSEAVLNPFDVEPPGRTGEEENPLLAKILSLHTLMGLIMGNLTPERRASLDRALLEIYEVAGIRPESYLKSGLDSPGVEQSGELRFRMRDRHKVPILTDLIENLRKNRTTKTLADLLEPFATGSLSVFNNQTNVDLEKPILVFGLRDLEEELRPVAMFIILELLWRWVRQDLSQRKIVVIDEAWLLMQYSDSARFLLSMAKRCRKYHCGLTTVTQNVGDFLHTQAGQAVITNSSTQFLLRQSPADIGLLTTTFRLSQQEQGYLLGAGRGEGLLFAGGNHAAVRVVASPEEHGLITTNPGEVAEIIKKAGGRRNEDV